ncbi:TonB-dependent receptor plug domain-containing protein [Thermodesulforhabdus norvegica]|uniref:Outer membrane receptor proteins, mostly Fe transport n=1 Tax=Thermodesulforhabdus norvegica TaxID=39841 RepID=A0A1I4T707_9BACT|nr:TonB-dependent receptor [Thermodesulforhabdus norvegica]SFM72383.1 Outer membrane receptor proteins, mostly Fe transport [Thermodesulforhabdus norvegica]
MKSKKAFVPAFLLLLTVLLLNDGVAANTIVVNVPGEIVVTASKLPQKQDDITQKIDIINRERIDFTPFIQRNIAEILRYQPGTFVNPLSRNDANWGSYGGLGPKYNVFLLDGLPIDSFADLMSLDPLILDRAEVHRGPASVMYPIYLSMDFAGNQTPLAGITNLITKEKIEEPCTILGTGYGSWNTFAGTGYHQGRVENLHYFLGASYERSDYTNYGTENSWLHILSDPDYDKARLFAKGTYFFDGKDSHKLSLFVHHTEHYGDVGRPNRDYDHDYTTLNADYSNLLYDYDEVMFQFKVGYRRYNRSWNEDNYPDLSLRSHDGVQQNIIPLDLSFNVHHGNGLLTFGSDAQWATYETYSESRGVETKGNDMNAWSFGLYAEEKYRLGKFVFRLGGRYLRIEHSYNLLGGNEPEVEDASWDKFTWSTGLRYKASDNLSLYVNAGSSFQAPSGKSVGGTLSISDRGVPGRNGQLPNPNLKPEEGMSFDAGADLNVVDRLFLNIRGFSTFVDDAIVENVVSRDPSQTQSVNAGKSKSLGVEIEGRYAITNSIEIFANYTFVHTKVENNVDPNQDGSEVPFVPSHLGNLGLVIRLPWDLTIVPYLHVFGKYYDSTDKTSRQSFGPEELINIHIEKPILKSDTWKLKLSLDLNNITDNAYEMPWQFRDPGFNTMIKADLVF